MDKFISGIVSVGGRVGVLARAKPNAAAVVDAVVEEAAARYRDVEELVASRPEAAREQAREQLRNKVRKCGRCGKPNAFTLPLCNGCSADLTQLPISYTPNVFACFALGVAAGAFPFTMTIRRQTPRVLVIDDLLALSRCHMNVLPTSVYVPDWTRLLAHPHRGLQIIDELYTEGLEALKQHFWPKRAVLFREGDKLFFDDIVQHIAVGFNYPPSQYQLHLQFIAPPFVPFQWLACQKGVHFTKGRFFPLSYVRQVMLASSQFEWKENSTIEELCEFYKREHNIDYDTIHAAHYKKYFESHELLANWDPLMFEGAVFDDEFVPFVQGTCELDFKAAQKVDSNQIASQDKLQLQNYGRPYENGKPTGKYYKHAAEVTFEPF